MAASKSLHVIPGRKPDRRWEAQDIAPIVFGVAVTLLAGMGFIYKMTEFVMTIVNNDIAGFGFAAVSVYLIGLLPIIFLTLWAVMTGRFRDIERPKFRMLELDREIERGGDLSRQRNV